MRRFCGFLFALFFLAAPGNLAVAAFHFMQIEQVIGGVNGDTTAQAVQLRMRSAGQNFIQSTKLEVVDANGANPVLLEDFTVQVPNSQGGRRILIATPNFGNYTNIPLQADFLMDPIPISYLAAGQVRFMSDFGTLIYWSLSWGGASYTGSTTGTLDNDANGNFGPPVNIALPSTSLQALQFTGSASAASTTNLADYALTAGAATFINNANQSFTLVAPDPILPGDFNENGVVDAADYAVWREYLNTSYDLGGNGDETGPSAGTVDAADYALWRANFGDTGGSGSMRPAIVPEPAGWVLFAGLAWLIRRSPRR